MFAHLSVFDSPKGSSDAYKTRKNISLYFKGKHIIIIYKHYSEIRQINYHHDEISSCFSLEAISQNTPACRN